MKKVFLFLVALFMVLTVVGCKDPEPEKNDGYDYEVMLTGYVTTGTTSGNYLNLNIHTDALTSFVRVCAAQTRTNATVVSAGSAVVPVSTGRIIKVFPYSSYKGTYDLNLVAYRRLGTNV